jgi:hypothetical protein
MKNDLIRIFATVFNFANGLGDFPSLQKKFFLQRFLKIYTFTYCPQHWSNIFTSMKFKYLNFLSYDFLKT